MANNEKSTKFDDEIANLEKMLLAGENSEDPKPGSSGVSKSTLFGDGDSSDDEDQRDFQNVKYNGFGKEINQKLKQQEEIRKYDSIRVPDDRPDTLPGTLSNPFTPSSFRSQLHNSAPSSSSASLKPEPTIRLAPAQAEPAAFCDPVFGLRIVQPLVSSVLLKERMSGKIPVGVQRLRFHTERGDLSKDWAVAGVVISKSAVKQTQKGDQFSIFTISDLKGEIKNFTLFLFRSAHKELWKTTVGTVIGILNPKVLERKDERIEAALSVDNHQKVMILGQSRDLGTCRSKKNNGEPCGATINKTECDVCIFHMKKEYSKVKRSEFQSSGLGRGLQDLRNKVLGKSEVFYAGQSFSAVKAAKKPAKMVQQDRERMMSLSEYNSVPYNPNSPRPSTSSGPTTPSPASQPAKRTGSAATHDTNLSQRKKDLERLKMLQGTDKPQMILSQKLAQQSSAADPVPALKPNMSFVPKLSSGNLSFTLSVPLKKNELAKQRAAALLKKKPLEASNPNLIKYRGTDAGKRKLTEELNLPSGSRTDENDAKKTKLADPNDDAKKRKEFLLKMMNAKSSHFDLVEDKEAERRDKCFDTMEKKEAMEERMANTMELPCKAVICKRCRYIYFSASSMCKEQRHELKVVDATKRFYQCGDCRSRTITLFRIPRDECKNCHSRNWKRTGMIKGRDAYVGEALSIRGDEELFIGSANNANLNLLVPE